MVVQKSIIPIIIFVSAILVGGYVFVSVLNDDNDNNNNNNDSDKLVGEYNWNYSYADYYQTNPYGLPTFPSSGCVFVKVDFKLKNIDSNNMTTSKSNFKFTANGITYEVEKVIGNSGYFADDIDKGSMVSRTFYYEVPIGYSNFTFEWDGKGNVQYNQYL